jgi:hypothetical protein
MGRDSRMGRPANRNISRALDSMRKKVEFGQTEAERLFAALAEINQLETLILKAHASIEHLLFCTLATRLSVQTAELPKSLQFQLASELALVGLNEGNFGALLRRFADIRNRTAHEFEPDWSDGILERFVQDVLRGRQEWGHECPYPTQFEVTSAAKDTILPSVRDAVALVFAHLCHIREQLADTNAD